MRIYSSRNETRVLSLLFCLNVHVADLQTFKLPLLSLKMPGLLAYVSGAL